MLHFQMWGRAVAGEDGPPDSFPVVQTRYELCLTKARLVKPLLWEFTRS